MTLHDKCMIKVPASTANLGPGFDSIGLALDLFLILEAEKSDQWSFTTSCPELKQFPGDHRHFICQVANNVASKYGVSLTPCKVVMESQIPLARGLGSSAAAIVAGIELADFAGGLQLTKDEKLQIATAMEGHPDNVGASIYGGLVVGNYQNGETDLVSFQLNSFEVVALIPEDILLTKDSRQVLPSSLPYPEAVKASSAANVLVAALLGEHWSLAGKMMEQDLFHQPYRKPLIPFYKDACSAAKSGGAFGVALSGAGPTILCFAEKGLGYRLSEQLKRELPKMKVKLLNIQQNGSLVSKMEKCS